MLADPAGGHGTRGSRPTAPVSYPRRGPRWHYDPVTGDVVETVGTAYPTANLTVIDTPVDNLDLRVVGVAEDVSEKRTTSVVSIDE
ncbi:MAG: hypothetical protein ACI9MR_003322 [Myxococcota bacterium]